MTYPAVKKIPVFVLEEIKIPIILESRHTYLYEEVKQTSDLGRDYFDAPDIKWIEGVPYSVTVVNNELA